jgi:hypothetical protein
MRRGELKRSTPLRATGPATARVKLRKCPVKKGGCGKHFAPERQKQVACGLECAGPVGAWLKAEKHEKTVRAEARAHREKLADVKQLSHWLALTERVVNHFIQTRDKGKPCISCGTHRTVRWEAGHFLSVGARPELRFVAKNINLQCHRCNVQLSGNQAAYRIGLVDKIGEPEVQELEGPHATAKYTREALEELRKQFAAETRALKKEQQ